MNKPIKIGMLTGMIYFHSEYKSILDRLHGQSQLTVDLNLQKQVLEIQDLVRVQGDQALIELGKKYDGINSETFNLWVTEEEFQNASDKVASEVTQALQKAHHNIDTFHRKQYPKNWQESPESGVEYGQRFAPLESVGLYVPGGRAVYPSTVLMNAIPAKIAGVDNIIIVTPANTDGQIAPAILVAAQICGVKKIIKSGGAQIIFALASGTQSVPKVNKIVGPGNKYVTAAKQMVYGQVDIDKPAGPSEVCIYVDDSQYAPFAAAELLAQLEHDPDAIGIAICKGEPLAAQVQDEFKSQIQKCKRQDILRHSKNNTAIFSVENDNKAVDIINYSASEHLVLIIEKYAPIFDQVKHAGSIFCGPYTPVTLGDYFAGPNHVLPTGAAARFASPLGVMDFMKYSSHLTYSKEALKNSEGPLKTLTEVEGFDAHYNAVKIRLN